jgi:hypothetical protein
LAGGTPQRFLFFSTVDPDPPGVDELIEHPGPLHWSVPQITDPDVNAQGVNIHTVGRRWKFAVADSVAMAVRQGHLDRLSGRSGGLEGHANLVQLKVAAVLGALDGRITITADDWDVAGTITTTSARVRDWLLSRIAAAQDRADDLSNERAAKRAEVVETARSAAASGVARIAATIARHVGKHHAETGGCTMRCLRHAVASKHRRQLEAAIGHAVAVAWIVETEEGRHEPGPSQPSEKP